MNRHLLVWISLFVGFGTMLNGQVIQSRKAWIIAGDSAFVQKDYYSAYKFYEAALEYDPNDEKILYGYSESARLFNANVAAEKGYSRVLNIEKGRKDYPEAYLWLGVVQHRLEKHELAIVSYSQYLKEAHTPNGDYEDLARKGIQECERVIRSREFATRGISLPARPERKDTIINGPFSDFGAVFQKDTIYFTTFLAQTAPTTNKDQRMMLRVKRAFAEQGLSHAEEIGGGFNIPGQNTSFTAFTPDNKGVYYAVCQYVNASDMHCELYYRDRLEHGLWGAPLRLSINDSKFTSTQPAFGLDAAGNRRLYFVSDRPGGKGKLDIWYGAIEPNGDVKIAENLSAVNTTGEDVSPFFHRLSNQLYFSTDGRVGLGGYDVFQSQLKSEGQWGEIRELGYQVNSSYDDLYFSLNEEGSLALFSSNRQESTPILTENDSQVIVCCYDIYSLPIDLDFVLDVATFDRLSTADLQGATVQVFELPSDGGDPVLLGSKTNLAGNDFTFNLQKNRKYQLLGYCPSYDSTTVELDLTDLEYNDRYAKKDLFLGFTEVSLDVFTFDAADHSPLTGTRVQLFQLNENGDTVPLDSLEHSQDNLFHFDILPNQPYLVVASKPGYNESREEFRFGPEELKRYGRKITVELELERIDFPILPINLYFDNAMPDGRSMARTTQSEYTALHEAYAAKKQEFIDQYVKGVEDEAQRFALEAVHESFFNRDVAPGKENLIVFADQLHKYLSRGHSLEIELKGYSSPRASETYNQVLSERRIQSVANFFRTYKDGLLMPYLKNGQFKLTSNPLGESRSVGVPDRIDDIKESIYSIKACIERRVEIVKVRTLISKPQ